MVDPNEINYPPCPSGCPECPASGYYTKEIAVDPTNPAVKIYTCIDGKFDDQFELEEE